MYDFCFTPIYAALLAVGGLMGYLLKGSTASLGGGLGAAGLLSLCAYISLQQYHKGRLCKPATLTSLVISSALSYVMGQRYLASGKVFPAGVTAALSAVMTLFYIWSLSFGPTPKAHSQTTKVH